MSKTGRKWLRTEWSHPDCVRAEDIPYDSTQSIKDVIDGDSSSPYIKISNDYTADDKPYIFATAATIDILVFLPQASISEKRIYTIKQISGSKKVFIVAYGSETIDGETTQSLKINDTIKIMCDGIRWYII